MTQRTYTIELRCTPKGKKGHSRVADIVVGMARLLVATLDTLGYKAQASAYSDDFFKGHEDLGADARKK